ncbi:hypothetical protein [Lysobacter gummosus]
MVGDRTLSKALARRCTRIAKAADRAVQYAMLICLPRIPCRPRPCVRSR